VTYSQHEHNEIFKVVLFYQQPSNLVYGFHEKWHSFLTISHCTVKNLNYTVRYAGRAWNFFRRKSFCCFVAVFRRKSYGLTCSTGKQNEESIKKRKKTKLGWAAAKSYLCRASTINIVA
jgi:hypothetical protein